jgi:hypothetical protein
MMIMAPVFTPACFSMIESGHSEPSRFPQLVRERAVRTPVWRIRVDPQVKVGTRPLDTIHTTCQGIECNQPDHFSLNLPRCWTLSIPQPASTVTSVRIVPELGIQPSIDRSTRQVHLPTQMPEVSCDLASRYSNER